MKRALTGGRSWYFGKDAYEKYSDLVRENCSGMRISKRIALAEKPGGLIYEAERIGLKRSEDDDGEYLLLECLEGMCYNREAAEIDDSTYEVF